MGEADESLSDEQKEEVKAPSEEVSDEGNSDEEGDDTAIKDPSDEDLDEEEPSEGDIEDPAEEEVADPAIDPDQMTIMEADQIVTNALADKKLYPSIDNTQKDKWTLTKIAGLSTSGKTYLTVAQIDSSWDGFIDEDTDTAYSTDGIVGDALTDKILAFGVDFKPGYQFKSSEDNPVKAGLTAGSTEIRKINATYVAAVQDGAPAHYEIDLGTITETDFGENESLNLKVWVEYEVQTYSVTLPGADANATVEITSGAGIEDGVLKTDASEDIVFTVTPADGYELAGTDAVQYKAGTGDFTPLTENDSSYTIPKESITGDITIKVLTAEIQYQITFDTTDATVKIGNTEVTGSVAKKLGEEVEFVVAPETGKKLRYVNTEDKADGAMSPTATDADNGTYTYTYTVNAADATDKAITIYVNATAAQPVTVSFNKTGTDTGVSVYEVKETGADSSKVLTVEDTDATSISSTEDSKVYFIAELPKNSVSAITSVKVGETELSPAKTTVKRTVDDALTDDEVDLYTLDLKDISTNVQVAIVTELDETKANVATFSLAGEGDYTATVGGKEYNVGDNALTADDSITFTVDPTEDYFQIDKVEAVYETAKADGSGKEEKTVELKADEDTGDYTFAFKDTEKNETVTREVTIKVTVSTKGAEDAVTFTVNNTSNHMKYEVEVKDDDHPDVKVTRKAGTNHTYIVEKGATYVNMTVKADDKFAPAVSGPNGAIKGEKTEAGYKYTIPAVSLASDDGSDTIITIGEEAEQKWIAVLYNESEAEVSAKVSGKEIIGFDKYSVEGEEDFSAEDQAEFAKIESYFVVYRVATDTEVTVAVTALDNSSVASYTIGERTTNLKVASGKTGEFKVKAENNTTVQINTDSVYGITLKDGNNKLVEGAKDTYAVDYGAAYTATLWKGEARANVTAVAIEGTDAASTAAPEEITIGNGNKKYTVAKINVAAADAGKTLTVKLSVAGKVTEDGVEKDGNVIVHTFKLSVNPKAAKLEIKGAKNDKLTQTVDTKTEYVINPTPKTVNLGNIEAEVTAAADGADAAAITAAQGWVQARVIDGKLEVITKAVKDPADKTDDVAKIVLKDKTTNEALTSVKVDATKPAFTSEEPGVKAVGSDDISLDLELTAPKKVTPPNVGKLWYKVVVTAAADAGTEITEKTAKPFYYEVKTDADGKLLASQTENIRVNGKAKGKGKACDFTVAVTLVQTLDETGLTAENEAAITSCTSKTKDNVAASTKTPYYTSKLSFKKGAGTVYTGQTVKIATPQFDKNTTWTEIQAKDIVDTTDDSNMVSFSVENGDIYMSVDPGYYSYGYYYSTPLGKHTIEVTAYAPEHAYAAKGTLTVNVVRGIEDISVSAPDTIYKADKKAAALKLAPILNWGSTNKDWVPKAKKVSYEIVDSAYGNPMSDALKAAVSVKTNGTVNVAKDYNVSADPENNKFAVKVTAADFMGNEVYDTTDDIEITATGMELGEICIADMEWNYSENAPSQYTVVSRGTDFTSKELDENYLIVLKKGVAEKPAYSADEVIDTNNLTFKSSNKALTIYSNGRLSTSKVSNKVKLTATANDGSKNAVEKTINIIYDKPAQLGLRVERQDDFDGSYYRIGEDNSSAFTFKGTPDTVLDITVVQRDSDKSEWEEVDQFTDFKLAVSGAKVLNKNSYYSQWQRVIANKATVNVKLTVGSGNDKKEQTYTITNEGFSTANAPKVKGKDSIKTWLSEQTITYEVTDTEKIYSGKKWVLVKTDAAERANAKKAEAYERLESASEDLNSYLPIDKEGKFCLNFNRPYYPVLSGSYKLQFTFGTVDEDGQFIPETKTVAVTLKAEAQKKGSYKAVSTIKMSLKDGAEARLAGSGKNYSSETFSSLYNANINGKPNNFRTYFKVASYGDIYYLALKPQGNGENDTLTAEDIAYITGDSKEAKNDRIGYVNYSVDIDGVGNKADTAKITVNFDKNADKTLLTYKASAPTIMEGTTEEFPINVTAGKANAQLAYVYIDSDKFEAANMSCDGSIISVKAKAAPTAGNYATDIYVVPTDNYYVSEIHDLYTAWRNAADTEKTEKLGALTDKIKARGVLVKTTIKVTAKDKTGGKIKIDKKDTAQVFSQNKYNGTLNHYYVHVPYTKTMPCDITEIVSSDKYLDGESSLFYFYADPEEELDSDDPDAKLTISVNVDKAKLEKALEANKVQLGKSYTVKATVKFGKQVTTADKTEWQTDATIKTEQISLKLTLPEAVTSTGYVEAVAAVKAAKASIIDKVSAQLEFQKNWVDEYGNLDYSEFDEPGFLEDAFDSVKDEVSVYAPEDSGTSLYQVDSYDGGDNTDVFKAPTSQKDGYFKAVIRLAKTDVYDEEDPKAETYEDITFDLVIAKTMEEPNDIKAKLEDFVKNMDPDKYADAQDEDTARKAILKDARKYVQIEKYDTLRMDFAYFYFEPATDKASGYISGLFRVWGIRYGGEDVEVNLNKIINQLDDIDATKSLIEDALALLADKATNLTTQEEVMDAAKAAIVNKQFDLEWKQVEKKVGEETKTVDDWTLTPATRSKEGTITGTLILVNTKAAEDDDSIKQVEITIDWPIPQQADSEEAITNLRTALGIDEDGKVNDTENDPFKSLVISNDSDTVKAAIRTAATKAVEKDGYTVAYKKNGEADVFTFTKAKYKIGTGDDTGKGKVIYTLVVTDTQAAEGTTVTPVEVTCDADFGPYPELATLADAKKEVEDALEDATFTNDTTATEICTAAQAAITANTNIVVDVKKDADDKDVFKLTEATFEAAGKIEITLVLSKYVTDEDDEKQTVGEPLDVELELAIAKLTQTLKEAGDAATEALDDESLAFTNADIEDATAEAATKKKILDAVEEKVNTEQYTVTATMSVKKATVNADGFVKIIVTITEKNPAENQQAETKMLEEKEYTIAALEQTLAEAKTAAEGAIEAYADVDSGKLKQGDADEAGIKEAVEAVVKTSKFTVAWGTGDDAFKLTAAEAGVDGGDPTPGSITGKIVITEKANAESNDTVSVNITWSYVAPQEP